MKIIAVMNQKGGIGKTITASSVGYILGEEFHNQVLIVDADQQGNISKLFGKYDPEGIGMSELLENNSLIGGEYDIESLIQSTDYEGINIIPTNGYLMKTNMNLLYQENDQVRRFATSMKEVRDKYDYVICDCGLILDMTVINILVAADLVIVPAKVGGFEIDAIENLEQQMADLSRINEKLQYKVLMTMRQGNKTSLEVEEWLKGESGYDVYNASIRRSIVVEKSTMAYKPLPKFSKNSIATRDYREVVSELVKDMGVSYEN